MPWTRRKPSGRWAATIYTPAGKRIERTFDLRADAEDWAAEQRAAIRRGDWIDPRLSEVRVAAWWERCQDSRRLEAASRRRDDSHWRCHVKPRWGKVPIGAILKPDISAWVNDMKHRGIGASTIHGSVNVLRQLLEQAVDAKILRFNPCTDVKLPRIPKHVDRVLTWPEQDLLLVRLDDLFPNRTDAGLFVRFLLDTGARWEEAAAVTRSAVDLRGRRVWLYPVVEADGSIREYGKTEAAERWVALSDELVAMLRKRVLSIRPGDLVFTSPRGGTLRYSNWRRRVWVAGIRVAADVQPERPPGRSGPMRVVWRHYLDDPQPTPHDCRHTFGSRLADEGLEQHKIAKRMGHASTVSTQRYIHASEESLDEQRAAQARSRERARQSSAG